MQEVIGFAIMVVAISASGVMSPGPLFSANIIYGLKEGKIAGLKIAVGHTIVEFPLIILLGTGIITSNIFPEFRVLIAVIGALGLFAFAGLQIKSIFQKNFQKNIKPSRGPILAGIFLSALNPFFIIWWLTVGLKLITESIELWGFLGIIILFLFHIWMDYVWLYIVAFFASKSRNFLSNRNYKILVISLAIVLIYFGLRFLTEI
jgi:threonine/homoserine/homoserine lactone efflux protein|tara:strand:+ start:692 stop:1306 length:615 start_codon:yes stop_codon:yes gene_type:complete